MQAQDFSGFTADLPRLFRIPTLAVGVVLLSYGMGSPIVGGQYPSPDESLVMGAGLGLLGLHGLVTNVKRVGILRRLLSYFSGAAGGVLSFNIAQMMGVF
ncbi:hypothetical protein RXV86_04185 [Alisedimentitalea sp. MJ-SS2]|uniref:hypothetical protein n=1 Tax=Aliisedimentitalea sp. MJ-SS2 TaxID=3049795 RepID=UPI00290F9D49|nr:hypothetical protein [Alisedimentitalea sp. MJ-SS2]MDU8926578.1 hypothetical protein [Alisedimentitalea sp. MJ-SS2]